MTPRLAPHASPLTLFVTGTDTGVGKTYVSTLLLRGARAAGRRACGYKPMASGCERDASGALRNDDALALQAAAGTDEPYERINPCAYEPPLAPHIAAELAGRPISLAQLTAGHADLAGRYDWLLVEGAGGWQVPLTDQHSLADWVAERGWPVLLVVGMRLGCLNHALLSAESILRRSPLLGWVANELPPGQPALQQNLDSLRRRLPAPLLGVVPPAAQPDMALAAALFEGVSGRLHV